MTGNNLFIISLFDWIYLFIYEKIVSVVALHFNLFQPYYHLGVLSFTQLVFYLIFSNGKHIFFH